MGSTAFAERWTFWLTTWLQNKDGNLRSQNEYFKLLRKAAIDDKPVSELAQEIIGAGDAADYDEFAKGTFLSSMPTTGPPSDTADNMLAKTATVFLGMSHYDCLLCHGGRGRVDKVNAWSRGVTRYDANGMAAFSERRARCS